MSTGYGGSSSSTNYYPNSNDSALKAAQEYRDPGLPLGDTVADRYDSRDGHDDYTQAGNLWRIFSAEEKERTAQAIAVTMSGVSDDIKMRQLCHFFRAEAEYGQCVAKALGIAIDPAMLAGPQSDSHAQPAGV